MSADEESKLAWQRDNAISDVEQPLSRRKVFSLSGSLTGHLPVCGWLRPATSYIKRRANEVTNTWDEVIKDPDVCHMVEEVLAEVAFHDPAKGIWNVDGHEMTVWVDASSLALGVVLEVDGEAVEDGCWLRKDDGSHINLAELNAALKGINMAILWRATKIHLKTELADGLSLGD